MEAKVVKLSETEVEVDGVVYKRMVPPPRPFQVGDVVRMAGISPTPLMDAVAVIRYVYPHSTVAVELDRSLSYSHLHTAQGHVLSRQGWNTYPSNLVLLIPAA